MARSKDARNSWSRDRVCIDCGRVDLVRKDNKSERCVSCSARKNASSKASDFANAAKKRRVPCLCGHCGKAFERTPSQIKRATSIYCSISCANEIRRVDRTCKCCGKSFQVGRARVYGSSNSSGNFCTRACYEKWLCRTSKTTGRGSQWKRIRASLVAKSPFCGWCGTVRQRLQVHHIVPFRLTHDNDNSNLIPLCCSCHKKVELLTVEIEATGISPADMLVVMNTFLRQRQVATAALLKRISNEKRH